MGITRLFIVSCDEIMQDSNSNREKVLTDTRMVGFENASIEFSIKICGIAPAMTKTSSSIQNVQQQQQQQQQKVDETTTTAAAAITKSSIKESKIDSNKENI